MTTHKSANRWLDLASAANEKATYLHDLGCEIEAQRTVIIGTYCLERYRKSLDRMLSRKEDKIINRLGNLVFIGISAALAYLAVKRYL